MNDKEWTRLGQLIDLINKYTKDKVELKFDFNTKNGIVRVWLNDTNFDDEHITPMLTPERMLETLIESVKVSFYIPAHIQEMWKNGEGLH